MKKRFLLCFFFILLFMIPCFGSNGMRVSAANEKTVMKCKVAGGGTKRIVTVSSKKKWKKLRMAVWSDANGKDDLVWYSMKKTSDGKWKATVKLSKHKQFGKYHAVVYSGKTKKVCKMTFKVSRKHWLAVESKRFKSQFLFGSNPYLNVDYVQCAINIARNNYYGYGHTWKTDRHTMSCAGLVSLTLTYCGYGDFIKDDPIELLDGTRWGYLDIGTYSGKYNWVTIMKKEAKGVWHSGLDNIKPGDILYYDYGIYNNHTAIYLGQGLIVEAKGPSGYSQYDDTGAEIGITSGGLYLWPWQGYFRIPKKHYFK